MNAATEPLALLHGCADPARCRHQLAARCAVNGQILCLYESGWLTGQERRRAQRELRAAQTEEQAARVVRHAEVIGTLRRIEREALEARREELRTDPAGYRRRHRAVAEAIRRSNLRKRREADARRQEASASAQAEPAQRPARTDGDELQPQTLAGWQRVAGAVLTELSVWCGAEGRGLLDLALLDPDTARSSPARFAAVRRAAETVAEQAALGVAESFAWAQLFGPRSASWTSALRSAAAVHGDRAYAAAMALSARTRNEEANRERRAIAAREAARTAAQARYAAWISEAQQAEHQAAAEQSKAFAASLRGADALSKARVAHLLRVAAEPAGFAPHAQFSGAKLGAWTRALRHLARLELVQDVGWRWVLTPEGAAVAQRLAERQELRAYRLRTRHEAAAARAQRALGTAARTERAAPRPARRGPLVVRRLERSGPWLIHARACERTSLSLATRRSCSATWRGAQQPARTKVAARGRDGPPRLRSGSRSAA